VFLKGREKRRHRRSFYLISKNQRDRKGRKSKKGETDILHPPKEGKKTCRPLRSRKDPHLAGEEGGGAHFGRKRENRAWIKKKKKQKKSLSMPRDLEKKPP